VRLAATAFTILLMASGACAPARRSSPVPLPPAPAPDPAQPIPPIVAIPLTEVPGPWSLSYVSGSTGYRITRTTTIEDRSGPGGRREVSSDRRQETISLTVESPTRITIDAVLDSLELTPRPAAADSLTPAARLSADLSDGQLRFRTDDSSSSCAPGRAILTGDLRVLAPVMPETLVKNATWTSSDSTTLCQAGIVMRSFASHTYTVLGEAGGSLAGLVQVRRISLIRGEGEGAQQQHRVKLSAAGTEMCDYYLETPTGRINTLRTDQQLDIQIENSGRVHRFAQQIRREYSVIR